jgi:aconitate hydratase
MTINDPFGVLDELRVRGGRVVFFSLERLSRAGVGDVDALPFTTRVLLESVLRSVDGATVTADHVQALVRGARPGGGGSGIPFRPARVLLQDFTGVPCLADLAALRDALARRGGDPARVDSTVPVDLVIDHSVQVDEYGHPGALEANAGFELERNRERYEFLKWARNAFGNLRVIPPAAGICHQVDLELLARVVVTVPAGGGTLALPDSVVGTDSHTPMVNGLGVVGWGVGGIEAEAVMLGRPLFVAFPAVVGVRLAGRLQATATDLVLHVTRMLRDHGVVGRLVEFFGPGLEALTVPDRATVANMAPEYGATTGCFPVDEETLAYLRSTGRSEDAVDLVERYCKEQGLWGTGRRARYEHVLELDLGTIEPVVAGPRRPQDRVALSRVAPGFRRALASPVDEGGFGVEAERRDERVEVAVPGGPPSHIGHGAVVIAAITSCTNTSNPSVMIAAGLLARKAVERGLATRPWVKTSLAPGSRAVTCYLEQTGLAGDLRALGFHTVGYGCTTCIGNSGPLPDPVDRALDRHELVVAAVLSGNRNFEGRIHPRVRASYLASPPLVVAYALAGSVDVDIARAPLGTDREGRDVRLADIWPSREEVAALLPAARRPDVFRSTYRDVESAGGAWNELRAAAGTLYDWDEESTYIRRPPFFDDLPADPPPLAPIRGARVLVMVGDSVTTDHISPAGAISPDTPAGRYLESRGVRVRDFNTYGSRRGNDRVMTRGTFANVRLRNELAPGTEGGWTTFPPGGEVVTVFEAARRYTEAGTPTIVVAGRDYGMGSSRDWAAKGTRLLGVRAVIAESYERIHLSNLVGMGVLPLQFLAGEGRRRHELTGRETFDVEVDDGLRPRERLHVTARGDGPVRRFEVLCRLDGDVEVETYRHGGILAWELRRMTPPGSTTRPGIR